MADIENLERGTQVLYVPNHVDEADPKHPEVLHGFVTSRNDKIVWCRFWNKRHEDRNTLRTRGTSEVCFPWNLVVRDTRPQALVDKWLGILDREKEEFLDALEEKLSGCPRDCRTAWPSCQEENCDE